MSSIVKSMYKLGHFKHRANGDSWCDWTIFIGLRPGTRAHLNRAGWWCRGFAAAHWFFPCCQLSTAACTGGSTGIILHLQYDLYKASHLLQVRSRLAIILLVQVPISLDCGSAPGYCIFMCWLAKYGKWSMVMPHYAYSYTTSNGAHGCRSLLIVCAVFTSDLL